MAPLRVGVIGVGFGATVHIPAFQSEGIDVVAVCAEHRERAEETSARFQIPGIYDNYRDLLKHPDLEAISVVTAPRLHYEMTLASLEAGVHVLCEKPFTIDTAQALQLETKVRETNLTGMIAHEFRFAPQRAFVKHLIQQGYIGDPTHLAVTMFLSFQGRPGIRRSPSVGSRGVLGALGSHFIDCMRDWFGDIVDVSGRLFGPSIDGFSLSDTNNAFQFDVQFANGAWGSMVSSFASPLGSGARLEIYGTEGSLQLSQIGPNPDQEGKVFGGRSGEDEGIREIPIPGEFRPFDDDRDPRMMPFRLLTKRFLSSIETGTSLAPNFYDGLQCQRVMDSIVAAHESGSRVAIS